MIFAKAICAKLLVLLIFNGLMFAAYRIWCILIPGRMRLAAVLAVLCAIAATALLIHLYNRFPRKRP